MIKSGISDSWKERFINDLEIIGYAFEKKTLKTEAYLTLYKKIYS